MKSILNSKFGGVACFALVALSTLSAQANVAVTGLFTKLDDETYKIQTITSDQPECLTTAGAKANPSCFYNSQTFAVEINYLGSGSACGTARKMEQGFQLGTDKLVTLKGRVEADSKGTIVFLANDLDVL